MRTRRRAVGVLALPEDPNPYQELIYGRLRRLGHRVRYPGSLTPSHSVNLLLLPFELVALRLRGYRILHIHWTFGFLLVGSDAYPGLRRVSRWWYQIILLTARAAGFRLVWTAHNLMPQTRVFDDDRAARRFLVGHADLVIGHSEASLAEVAANFGEPARSVVIPIGPYEPPGLAEIPPPLGQEPRTVLFFGLIEPYKGVEDLLHAALGAEHAVRLVIAGRCDDAALESEIRRLAAQTEQTTLQLEFIPEEQIYTLFSQADAVAFPYRNVTTSSAVVLAAVAGRPAIVPNLPAFAHFPDEAVFRYSPGAAGLSAALDRVAQTGTEELRRKGSAAQSVMVGVSWDDIVARTSAQFTDLLEA